MEKPIDREKQKSALKRACRVLAVASFVAALLAILLLVGAVITLIMAGRTDADEALLYILCGSFVGGACLSAAAAVFAGTRGRRANERELDFRELCDGENSFFVGDGTLATFEEGSLRIHAEVDTGKEDIRVPYGEMRFFSVCSRTRPRERGKWSVALEIPARYLTKTGRDAEDGKPALVETNGKERLYACLEAHNLELLGEKPPRGDEKPKNKKFTRTVKCNLPNVQKRRQTFLFMGFGAVVLAAGVLIAVFFDLSIGLVLGAVGLFVLARTVVSFLRAKATLALYEEGIFWQDSTRTESMFLKWGEIESVRRAERDGAPCLELVCAYGSYHFPAPAGFYEYIGERFPDKCK